MRKLLTLFAILGPLAPIVLADCDPPSPPAAQPTPSCDSLNVTIPDPTGTYDRTDNVYWWSCCNLTMPCGDGLTTRFQRFYYEYSDEDAGGMFSCYDTEHTSSRYNIHYGCCGMVSY